MRHPDALPGGVPFATRCRIVDANGKHIPYLLSANTETGEVERYDRTPDGKRFKCDPVTKRVVIIRETHPAPLQLIPLAPDEPYFAPPETG